jgi:hypothetical protein
MSLFAFAGGSSVPNNPELGLKILGVMIILIILLRLARGEKSK